MANFVFKNLLVRSFTLDHLEVWWEIENTMLDPHDFQWSIERLESPMGPWDLLAGPFEDKYRFIDDSVNLLHRWRRYFYRLSSVEKSDTNNVVYSESITLSAEPDLIAKEIQLLEATIWREFTGRACWIFPARTFGLYCPSCFDGVGKGATRRKTRSGCLTCYDRSFAGGYLDPIQTEIQFDPSPSSSQQLSTGETQQSNTTARLGNFPPMKPDDMVVEAENRRWRVVRVSTTQRLRAVVHQDLILHEIVKGDIEFDIPINLADLRSLDPNAGRNFTNPQNLESFEDEAFQGALKSYGYDTTD